MRLVIFTQRRSGGSLVSHLLSKGMPILTEPSLPSLAPGVSDAENIERLGALLRDIADFQVTKLVDYKPCLDLMQKQGVKFPFDVRLVFLIRHPVKQIASHLYALDNWADRWTPHEVFFKQIAAYRQHAETLSLVQSFGPVEVMRYEDCLGDGWRSELARFFEGRDLANATRYAEAVKLKHFRLGPSLKEAGSLWSPASTPYSLSPRERTMVWHALESVAKQFGYDDADHQAGK